MTKIPVLSRAPKKAPIRRRRRRPLGAAMLSDMAWREIARSLQLSRREQHTYMRSLFELVVCVVVGVAISLWTPPKPEADMRGLFMSSIPDAMRLFKGGVPNLREPLGVVRLPWKMVELPAGEVRLPATRMERLAADPGDLLYVTDERWWLGGLRSVHVRAGTAHNDGEVVQVSAADSQRGSLLARRNVRVEKIM